MVENDRILKAMSVGDVLDYSIEVYKKNFKTLSLIAIVLYIPMQLLTSLITGNVLGEQILFYGGIFKRAINNTLLPDSFLNNNINTPSYLLFSVLSNIMSFLLIVYSITVKLVMHGTIIETVYSDVVKSEKKNIWAVIKENFRKLPNLMGNAVLFNLIVYGILGASILIAVLIGIFSAMMLHAFEGQNTLGAVLMGLIFLFLILAVLTVFAYFAIKYLFGAHAVVLEKKSATESISRSAKLVKKNYWHTGLVVVSGMILFYILTNLFSTSVYLTLIISKKLFIIVYTITTVIEAVFYPYFITLLTIIYINLRIKNEGLDLEVKVDKLLEDKKRQQNTNIGETLNDI